MGQFGIGQAVRRVEDRRFLTGSGQYLADIEDWSYADPRLAPHGTMTA